MADYTYIAGQTIRFGRKDTELTHLWDFGDGNTSTLPNPLHTYSSLGAYTVAHTSWNPCGTCTGGTAHTVEIVPNLSTPSTADYKFQLGEETHFNRQDTELTHLWDFGDGNTSTLPDLFYIYTTPGIYTVTHTAYNVCGTCVGGATHTVEILQAPGNLDTSSVPPGAKIFVDDIDTGLITPAIIPDLTPGSHTIKLTLTGYEDSISIVNIISGDTVVLSVIFNVISCTTTTKLVGDTVTLSATPVQGVAPYTIQFRISPVQSMGNDASAATEVIPDIRIPGGNNVSGVSEGVVITRVYTLDSSDLEGATTKVGDTGPSIIFAVETIDSCTPPQSCIKYCKIFVGCTAPVCDFTVT